jgi:hypothetical protein
MQQIAVSLQGHIYRCIQTGSARERLEVCRFIVPGLGTVTLSRKDGEVLVVEAVDDHVAPLLVAVADRIYACWQLVLS